MSNRKTWGGQVLAGAGFVDSVAPENVRRSVAGIANRSEVLREMLEARSIEIVGGMYDISTGAVEFF